MTPNLPLSQAQPGLARASTPLNKLEMDHFRLKANMLAIKAVLRTLGGLFAASSPAHAQAMKEAFDRLRETNDRLVLKELDPASSNMIAAEFQDIMDDLLRFIENGVAPPADPQPRAAAEAVA